MQHMRDTGGALGVTLGAVTAVTAAAATYYIATRPEPLIPPTDINDQATILEDGSRISKFCRDGKLLEYYYDDVKTTFEGFKRGLQMSNDGPCLGTRPSGSNQYVWQSYQQIYDRARAFGSGLIADGLEARNDTFIGIYSINRAEWVITDQACAMFSMVSVPLYDTLGPDACKYIINQIGISHVVVDKEDKIKLLLEKASSMPTLACIIVMENVSEETKSQAAKSNVKIVKFSFVEADGKQSLQEPVPPKPKDLMTVCYTSGTTGDPKGVMISHRNMVANMSSVIYSIKTVTTIGPEDRHLSYLPLAHNFERGMNVVMYMHGCQVGFSCGDIRKLPEDLQSLKPQFFPTVPRLLNRIYDKVLAATKSSALKRWLFNLALSEKMKEIQSCIIRKDSLWDYLVFGKIQKQLGGKVRIILTGSAPIEPKVMDFSRCAFGCLVMEGYGQTEALAGCTLTIAGDYTTGHVGSPLPGCKVKVVDVPDMGYFAREGKGEVCVFGPNVFSGYFNNKEKTKEALDKDGWLHTGDIGVWLPNGTLKIVDRKKNIFKLAQGEYIAPEKIEIAYMRSEYVAQVFIEGDSLKPFLLGIIVPDAETIMKVAKDNGVSVDMESVCQSKKIKDIILKDIIAVGKSLGLKSFEQVRDIHLHHELFSVENNLLTSTFKNKRPQLRQFFNKKVQDLYAKHEV
ncbi:long-chain-fatty-acid--CoA ligase 1-like [Mytilus edulis]|uniref:long-chain-fatty-acid--CoA ligase 1-like n=1 Tax=Mytilus edulis TaxID=6550 RepID=UPI0039EFC262